MSGTVFSANVKKSTRHAWLSTYFGDKKSVGWHGTSTKAFPLRLRSLSIVSATGAQDTVGLAQRH